MCFERRDLKPDPHNLFFEEAGTNKWTARVFRASYNQGIDAQATTF
jgi:hypothetical protein